MEQSKRRLFLLKALIQENRLYEDMIIPEKKDDQEILLRSLMNVRMAEPIHEDILMEQDKYLQERNRERGIVSVESLQAIAPHIYLWRGDLTRLNVDAIVNPATSSLTGCYRPNHQCTDNCIHTYAGMQLRYYCSQLIQKQGREESIGSAVITSGYNLPASYIVHTVGPVAHGLLTKQDELQLRDCYRSCFKFIEDYSIQSIAFPSFLPTTMFPTSVAVKIALQEAESYRSKRQDNLDIIFVVDTEEEERTFLEEITH